MWLLYNAVTDCYAKVITVNGLNAKLGMDWVEVSLSRYNEAIARGWVEYEPGHLRPPTPAPAAADAATDVPARGDVTTVTSDAGVTSRAMWVKVDGQDTLFVEASAVHAHIATLQAQLADARARAAELERLLGDARDTLRFVVATHEMWGTDKLKADEVDAMTRKVLQRISAAEEARQTAGE